MVRDYDEAIAFHRDVLGFELREDTRIDDDTRWVAVSPPGAREAALLLARAATGGREDRIGDPTGGRVGWFPTPDACERDHARMPAAGVVFEEASRREPYGTVAVFRDLHGNRWDPLKLHRPGGTGR